MRKLAALFLALAFLGVDAGFASAQEAHPTVALTGCLAEADDGDVEFMLRGVESDEIADDEVELSTGEGVNLAPHVGHTVEATGLVIGAEMDGDMGDAEGDHPDVDDANDGRYVYVTELSHIAASCEGG